MTQQLRKNIYFASDFHLGAPNYEESRKREKLIVSWLDEIKNDAQEIYLVGDVFDFWFEYKSVIPKGFVRLQGKIAALTDSGIAIHWFIGNHDMWIFDYLPKELGITLHRDPLVKTFNGKKFLIGHGDGLGPGDYLYKLLKAIFLSKICQWAFARIHPNFGVGMAQSWSKKSRKSSGISDAIYHGDEKEHLVAFCNDYLQKDASISYFIFGHRHLPMEVKIGENAKYVNLGEWLTHNTYAVFDGEELALKTYPKTRCAL